MNEISLSGTLVSDVSEYRGKANVLLRTAKLMFDVRRGCEIQIVGPGQAGEQLSRFRRGDALVVVGKLISSDDRIAIFFESVETRSRTMGRMASVSAPQQEVA